MITLIRIAGTAPPPKTSLRFMRCVATRFAAGLCLTLGLLAGLAVQSDVAVASSSSKSTGGMDRMVTVVPMPITIIHEAKVKGILMVEFYLEAPNMAEADRIYQLMPRLLDTYRTDLNEFATNEVRLSRPVNLDRLELYLNRGTQVVINNKKVRIIFRQIMVQTK